MESFKKFWSETLEIPEARWIVTVSGLVICVAVAYYIVKLFRDMALGKTAEPTSYISEFQKLRAEGKLDDEEYARLAKSIPKVIPEKIKKNDTEELPDFEELPKAPE